jgi:hypothetical protein
MKKIIVIIAGSCLLLSLSSTVDAKGYISLGGGWGGRVDSFSLRAEAGGYSTDRDMNFLFGAGLVYTFKRDETNDIINSSAPPLTIIAEQGTRKKRQEIGPYLKFGLEPIQATGVYIFMTAGATFGKEIHYVRSRTTGSAYEQSESSRAYPLVGAGIGYFPKDQHFCIQLEGDTRMGPSVSIGYNW